MHKRGAQRMATITLAVGAALAWAHGANAAGAMNIATCQLLSAPNTVYKLIADLATCGDCLIVAADKITIDLQNHAISSTCPGRGSAITDKQIPHDLIVVKNGVVNGYQFGIVLYGTRVSVIGVDASDHALTGIFTGGGQSLIKSCVANNNGLFGVLAVGEGAQIQQCDANNNGFAGILAAPDCLLTMNSANNNSRDGILSSDCAVSFNTANANGRDGINTRFSNFPKGTGSLVTQNTAIGNGHTDFVVACPGDDVTFNTSSGLPTSYAFKGSPPCHTAHNH